VAGGPSLLRNNFYMQNFLLLAPTIVTTRASAYLNVFGCQVLRCGLVPWVP